MEKGLRLPEVCQTPASWEERNDGPHSASARRAFHPGSQASGLAVFPLGPAEALGTQSSSSEVEKDPVCSG